MDIADIADIDQQALFDAKLQTARNLAALVNINGDGYCLDCGSTVEPVECNGQLFMPRWCCPECKTIWERDGN